jgi:histidinol-phosphate aminotransferase
MRRNVSKLKRERAWLIARLTRIEGLTVFDSEANFVLVCTGQDSSLLSSKLRSLGISVKEIGDVLDFRGCLRVTVGTRPMNQKFTSAMEQVMRNEAI